MTPQPSRALVVASLVTVGLVFAKIGCAASWDLLADEAYYARWSTSLALGYYDQPPMIAWVIGLSRSLLGDTDVAVRLPAILAGLIGSLALLPHYKDREFGLFWWASLPPLAWLTTFATPDALLLGAWSVAVSAALTGGWWWLLAGFSAAIATMSKYTGLALLPLLWIGTGTRSRHALAGVSVFLLLMIPHAGWLITHDYQSVTFQLHEGVLNDAPPGWLGPIAVVGQQLGVLTPFGFLAVVGGWLYCPPGESARVGWWLSAPLFAFFLLASVGGPPEAHWLAPAWIGAGLLLSSATGRLARIAWVSIGVGGFSSLVLVLHALFGLFLLPHDPADRLHEGRILASLVGAWALPEGVGLREDRAEEAALVRTERYQEAALIWWYAGIDAFPQPGCARENQYDHWESSPEMPRFFVRPTTSGPDTCVGRGVLHRLVGQDLDGHIVGRWDLIELPQ